MSLGFVRTNNEAVQTGGNAPAIGTGDFTLAAWVYRTDSGAVRQTVASLGTHAPSMVVRQSSTNVFTCYHGASVYAFDTALSLGEWYFLAIRRSGSTLEGFVNGVKEATSHSYSTSIAAAVLTVGSASPIATNPIGAKIEDLALWGRAVSDSELASIHRGRLRAVFLRTGVMGYWPLNAAGDAVLDAYASGDLGGRDHSRINANLDLSAVSANAPDWDAASPGLHGPSRVHVVPNVGTVGAGRRISLGGIYVSGGRVVSAG